VFHQEQDEKAMELLSGFDEASLEIVADFLEKMADLRQAASGSAEIAAPEAHSAAK
jgi:hypothetical protein